MSGAAPAFWAVLGSYGTRTFAPSAWGMKPSLLASGCSKRLKYHADQAAHIGEHILSMPQDEKVLCWMPGCTATGEWYPLQLADHHYAAHGINLMKNPEDARWLFISDDATLMAMSDETRQLFQQESLPFFRVIPTLPGSSCRFHRSVDHSMQ